MLEKNVYERLGVRTIIDGCGTWTVYGGAIMPPEVVEAMAEAAKYHVVLKELQEKAGQRIAELIGVEAAYVSSGAAGGLVLATAACVAGKDPAKIARLPFTEGMKNEVIMHKCHRMGFDHSIRSVGVKIVEVGLAGRTFPWEIEAAINDTTAAIVYVAAMNPGASVPFEEVVGIARKYSIPTIVDHAAEIPPLSNLRKYSDMGADLVVFSGGKGLRGPQSAGLILGRRGLIEACALNGNPNHSIGRPMKVSKEEIVGMATALELYIKKISKEERDIWEGMVAHIVAALADVPHVKARRLFPYRPTRDVPIVIVSLDEKGLGMTRERVIERLREGEPSVFVAPHEEGIFINPHVLLEGQERIIAARLREVLTG